MGRTHIALERADEEIQKNLTEISQESQSDAAVSQPDNLLIQTQTDQFQEIKTKLVASLPSGSVKTILFTGVDHGDGCSITAAGFADTLARHCRLDVLLIDANLRSPRLHEIFNAEYRQGLVDLLTKKKDKTSLFKKVGHGNLYLLPCGKKHSKPLAIFDSRRFENTLKLMREKFDFVILDAPPVNGYSETKIMGKNTDGVILVIEAGKTRRQVAVRAKEEMEKAGAKILGVIINKREHFIPEWIYKRL